MEASQTLQLVNLSGLSRVNRSKLQKQLDSTLYNDFEGYGFREVSGGVKYINATLVKKTPTFILQFEPETGKMIEQEIFLFSTIDFRLDFNFDLLEVIGSSKNVQKVMSAIYPFVQDFIKTEAFSMSLFNVVTVLSPKTSVKVERLVINKFLHKEGMVGRYDVQIDNPKEALQILKLYKSDVSKINFSLRDPLFGEGKIIITNAGSITIKGEEEELIEIWNFLKSKLFERTEKKNG
jgi:hypothetical protein